MLLLIASKDQIVDGLARIEPCRKLVWIELLAYWIRGEGYILHKCISARWLHQVNLKLHHVLVGVLVIHRERQAMAYGAHGHNAERFQTLVGGNKLAEVAPGVGNVMDTA